MKPLLLLITLLVSSYTLLLTQNPWEHVITDLYTNIQTMDVYQNDLVALGGSVGSCQNARVFLFDAQGNMEWEVAPFGYSYSRVYKLFFQGPTLWVFGTAAVGDDFPSPTDGFRVAAYDLNGNQLSYHEIPVPPFSESLVTAFFLDNNQLAIIGNLSMYLLNPSSGVYTGQVVDEDIWIRDAALVSNSIIALQTNSEIQLISTTDGTFISSYPADDQIQAMVSEGEFLWFVDGIEFKSLTPGENAELLDTIPINNTRGMRYVNGNLLAWGRPVGGRDSLYSYHPDQGWTFLHEPGISIRDVWNWQNTYYLSGPYGLGAYVRRQTSPTWSLPPSYDIAITDVFVTGDVVIDTLYYSENFFEFNLQANLQVQVQNVGTGSVNHFVIHSDVIGGFNCAIGHLVKTVSNAGLSSGESDTYDFTFDNYVVSYDPDELSISLNFFCWGPNHRIDETSSNNSGSTSILTDLLSSEDISPAIRIFPNPATSEAYLELPADISIQTLRIFNTQGKLVKSMQTAEFQKPIILQRDNLPGGIYLLVLETSLGIVRRKLVFQ